MSGQEPHHRPAPREGDEPVLWRHIAPSIEALHAESEAGGANGAPRIVIAHPDQPIHLTSPETTLDTALALAPALRGSSARIAELVPLVPADIEIVIPSPASKSDGTSPAEPTVVAFAEARKSTVSSAAHAAGVPAARLVSALVQCAVLHSTPQPVPVSPSARRLTGWIHGLAPMDAYLLHTAVLDGRVPRAGRVQASGISGRSRAEQLCTFLGALVAADPALTPLFGHVYAELNPLASESRAQRRLPELAEPLPGGRGWGGSRIEGPSVGRLFGLLHPELDFRDGWLLVSRAKKGAPRDSWTIEALRETQRSTVAQLSRTGGGSLEEVREKLAKAKVPVSHADDTAEWLDYCDMIVRDGVLATPDDPVAESTHAELLGPLVTVFPGSKPSLLKSWSSFLSTSVYPDPAELTDEQIALVRGGAESPLGASLAGDRWALLVQLSRLANADFDSLAALLGDEGVDPLDALESMGVPARALLDALSEVLSRPRGAYVALHMMWATNRCRGNGSARAHYSESKAELGGVLLRHPATFSDPDPAFGWLELLDSPWWTDPRAPEGEGAAEIPGTEELRRLDHEGEFAPDVLHALESAAFRRAVDERVRDTLAEAARTARATSTQDYLVDEADAAAQRRADAPSSRPAPETLLDWERELATRLDGASLVSEGGLWSAGYKALTAELSARFADLDRNAETFAEFFDRYPAASLAAIVGISSVHAYAGQSPDSPAVEADLGVLPRVAEMLGLDPENPYSDENRALRDALGSRLGAMLREFGLEGFAEVPADNIGDILVAHSGLPVGAMEIVADILLEFTHSVPDRTLQGVRQWLLDPSQRDFFLSLPTGTQVLVRYAAGPSSEILEGAVDIVEMFRAGMPRDAVLAAETQLPEPLGEILLDALEAPVSPHDGRLSVVGRRAADRTRLPYLWLDGTDAVCVALPPVSKYSDDSWVVTTGDEVTQVRPRRSLRDDETQLSLLGRPTRRVAVTHPSFHSVAELRLFTTDFPVALFLPDGRHVPTSSMVPEGEVFALIPPGHDAAGPESGGPVVLETLDTPEGWGQWTLQLWSLAGLPKVVVHDAAGVSHEILVGSRELPALWDTEDEPLDRLTGVESETGVPVLAVRPWLDVPPIAPGRRPWQVTIRRTGTDEWHTVGQYAPDGEHEGHALFDEDTLAFFGLSETAPVLGGFDVRIEGPEHARVDISIFVAEGFYAHFPESPRLPETDGATPAVAELSAEPVSGEDEVDDGSALSVSASAVEFGADTRKLRIQVSSGERSETLVLRPPRLKFRVTGAGMAPAWSDQVISRSAFDLEGATLVVRDPYATLRITLQLVDAGGRLTQRAEFDRDVDGTFRLDLGRFSERAKVLRAGEIRAVIIDPDAEGTRSYKRVATLVRFGTVADQHITLEGRRLRVPGGDSAEDLVCRVWQLERPWMPAMSLPVADGFAPLPPELDGAGRLRVDVAIEDPWDPVPAAALPHRGTTSLQTASRFSNTGRGLLSQFLAGRGAATYVASSLPEVWSAWALLAQNLHPATDRPQRAELAAHLRSNPRANLISLDRSLLSSPEKVAAFIASGLVNEPVGPALPGGDQWDPAAAGARRSMAGSTRPRESWIDVFVSIATISALPPRLRLATAAHLREVGGDSLHSVLAFGEDPLQGSVRLGLPEVQAAMDPTLRQVLLSRPTIPGPLLDASSRWEGLLALLRNESAFTSGYVRDQFERMLGRYESLRRFRPLYRLITERIKALPATVEVDTRAAGGRGRGRSRGKGRATPNASQAVELPMWSNIPQLTFSLALLARGHAYGYFASGLDQELLDLWARLVRQAPQQIVIDLVLAEAHIAHLRLGGTTFLP